MKEIRIRCEWSSTHTVEVPDDYEFTGALDDEWADQVDAHTSELVDWQLT